MRNRFLCYVFGLLGYNLNKIEELCTFLKFSWNTGKYKKLPSELSRYIPVLTGFSVSSQTYKDL